MLGSMLVLLEDCPFVQAENSVLSVRLIVTCAIDHRSSEVGLSNYPTVFVLVMAATYMT